MLYVCQGISCKTLSEYTSEKSIENILVEINFRLRKWHLSCSYNPMTNLITNGKGIDFCCWNMMILLHGDFSAQIINTFLEQFCGLYNVLIQNCKNQSWIVPCKKDQKWIWQKQCKIYHWKWTILESHKSFVYG